VGYDVGDHVGAYLFIQDKIITLQKKNICVVMNAQLFSLLNSFAEESKN
jgi:hypothetical protein